MNDNDPSSGEIGLEFSLTAYDEGFEEYIGLEPAEEEEEQSRTKSLLHVEEESDDDDKSCCSFLDKPSVSKDHSHDGTASTTVNSFDEGQHDTTTTHPTIIKDNEEEDEWFAKGNDSTSLPPPPPRDTFLARIDASRAYMTTFPDTVKSLESKVTQLLDELHAKAKQCQAVEAQLALVQHEACRQAEQVVEFYTQVAVDKDMAAARTARVEQESQAKEEQIVKLLEQQEATQQAHQTQVQKLEQALAQSRTETAEWKLKSEQDISQVLEDQKQQLTESYATQVATLTATLESERDTHRTALAVHTQTAEQLRVQLEEWKERSDHYAQETTRLTQEKATVLAERTHMAEREARYLVQVDDLTTAVDNAKAELIFFRALQADFAQYQADAKAKQTKLETQLSTANSSLEQSHDKVQELERRNEATSAELSEYIQRASRLEKSQSDVEQERAVLQRQVDTHAAELASWKDKCAKAKQKHRVCMEQAEELTKTLQRLIGAHEQASQNVQQAHTRIEALEHAKFRLTQELAEALERTQAAEAQALAAQDEASTARAMSNKLQDSAKRRRDILAQHRRN